MEINIEVSSADFKSRKSCCCFWRLSESFMLLLPWICHGGSLTVCVVVWRSKVFPQSRLSFSCGFACACACVGMPYKLPTCLHNTEES